LFLKKGIFKEVLWAAQVARWTMKITYHAITF